MKKRVVSTLLCVVMSVAMLAGCGGNSGDGSKSSSETSDTDKDTADSDGGQTQGTNTFAEGGTELSLWTFQEQHVGFWTEMADVWNEQYPDELINLTVTTGEAHSIQSKMLVAAQAGKGGPDIADIEVGYYSSFVRDGYLLPINDVVEPYKDEVVMSRIEMYGDNEGNYYGIDFHLGASVTYYNMDIMDAAGIDPAAIVTWDDFTEAGKVVLEKTGKPMMAVETTDLFFPQLMLLEKGGQYVDEDGNPSIATAAHAEVIDYIREMIDLGICVITPGGKYHADEWYGFLNDGGVATVSMPLWYMGRFIDYCEDLSGKMAIHEIPVWNQGDTREVLQGGTGTSVFKNSENTDLAKKFLAFAKLSEEGNIYEWNILGFDPIRTSLWDDPEITENENNVFLQYFITNPFDILKKNGTDITAPDIQGAYSAVASTLYSTVYARAFETETDTDALTLLEEEQSAIIYD